MRKTLVAIFLTLVMVLSFSVSAFAVPVGRPSVTKSAAPEVEEVVVVDENGNAVETLPIDSIIITPVDAIYSSSTPRTISTRLGAAYTQLASVESVAELPGDGIKETIEEEYGEGAADDFAVRELFDLQLNDTAKNQLEAGNKVTVKFSTNIMSTDSLVVMINYEGNKWMILSKDDVILNDDGTVSITFSEPFSGPVAFLVYDAVAGTDTTPFESGKCNCWHCINVWPCICNILCDNCLNLPFCPCWIIVLLIIVLVVVTITLVIRKIVKKNKEKKNK